MANERMRDEWAGRAEAWVTHKDLFDTELAPFAEVLLHATHPGPGDRVLDVGCGTGALVSAAVADRAEGVGVDISTAMVDSARRHVPGASFEVADAQVVDLRSLGSTPGPFTTIVSRFGVMFFDDPVAAFANIRRAAAPDATLAFVCWRGADENPMFSLGSDVLVARMDPRPPVPEPNAPGPVAFADPARVRSILDDAGWSDVDVEPFDAMCDYGRDGSDGVEERLTMVLNVGSGRLARLQLEPRLGPDAWAALLDDVRADLRDSVVDGSVRFVGATWLVTARNRP